jgi:hypothetical protein
MRFNPMARPAYLAPALGLVLVTAISACSSSSSSSSSSTASTAPSTAATSAAATSAAASTPAASGGSGNAVSEITANWNTFFNPSTSTAKREQLLQNGTQFSAAISAFSASPLAAAVTSKVNSVSVTSATAATVKYDLSAMGTTVASGASGSAVLQDGIWKVGDSVFCGLLGEAVTAGVVKKSVVPAACS